jgi:hypothetical protein
METPKSANESLSKEAVGFDFAVDTKHSDDSAHNSVRSVAEGEVFAIGEDGVNFRTVGWIRAAMFFTKMTFAAGKQ